MSKPKIVKKKHIPIRTCIVTREKKPKDQLIRIVKIDKDIIVVDQDGKQSGRGANISQDVICFDEAIKKGLIERALKYKKKFTEGEIQKLRQDFISVVEEKKFRSNNSPVTIRVRRNEK